MRSTSTLASPRLARLLPLIAVLVALAWPGAADACPVCFVAREASRLAFLWTAILMTFLPLGMLAGIVYWVWRMSRQAAAEAVTQPQQDSRC